jgi:outer membrane protein insertion porin family
MAGLFEMNPGKTTLSVARWMVLSVVIWIAGTMSGVAAKEKQANLDISGYGVIGNVELRRILKSLDLRWKERKSFDANFVEDAAMVVVSRLHQDGFLNPTIDVQLKLTDGRKLDFQWHDKIDPPLPRPLAATEVRIKIRRGVLYRYGEVVIEGITQIPEKQARSYFVERGVLVPLKRTRIYTPEKLRGSLGHLTEALNRLGFEHAEAVTNRVAKDDRTGKVDVTVEVKEGAKSLVRMIRTEFFVGTNSTPAIVEQVETNAVYSRIWLQDFTLSLRRTNYHRGYPDTQVEVSELRREEKDGTTELDLLASVAVGEQVRIGQLKFVGLEKTKRSVVARRAEVEPGQLLDRTEVEAGRNRLARLGIFNSVGVRYEIVNEHLRDVTYAVEEGKKLDVSLLFGYGSYELLRAGVEVEQFNMFGRAHQSRLRAVQSFKATSVDYRYTMPELIGESVDAFANAFFLDRKETTFTRREFGGGVGAKTFVDVLQSDFSARYNYQVLSADQSDPAVGPAEASVGAVILELDHDRRDSPLYPRRGYKISTAFETASEYLGGDVNYWRFEIQGAVHRPLDEGRWIHLGMSQGIIITSGDAKDNLPFNKRFFPGGDNSVRGFQYGEAAPRNTIGQVVGAETYTVGNVEFEQALTDKLSFVLFTDAIGFARNMEDYPSSEVLLSVGAGLRWKTIVGPVRLEYGHNVLRRNDDPSGAIHFSIGFPF